MSDSKLVKEEQEKLDADKKRQLAEDFLKTVESTLRAVEKETWLTDPHNHPYAQSSSKGQNTPSRYPSKPKT